MAFRVAVYILNDIINVHHNDLTVGLLASRSQIEYSQVRGEGDGVWTITPSPAPIVKI